MRDAVHRRQHYCAIIEDLACSGFNLHPAVTVVGLSVGMMAVRAVLCCAVLLPFVLLVYASTEVTKNGVVLPESAPESYEQIIKYVLGKKLSKCLLWKKNIHHAGRV